MVVYLPIPWAFVMKKSSSSTCKPTKNPPHKSILICSDFFYDNKVRLPYCDGLVKYSC